MDSLNNGFSILIPSWNNLPFLKLCIKSIHKNSVLTHEIIVFVNEGQDGTAAFLKEFGITHLVSEKNLGVCVAINRASEKASRDWLVYLNDDMYVLPGWDRELANAIEQSTTKNILLSGTMVEPLDSGNRCVIVADYGDSPGTFSEEKLLREFSAFQKNDWSGSSWPPILVARELWQKVGGYSEEFSPGMSSDPDFSMKLWKAGVRDFRGIAKSRVYHFQAKSTGRIQKNNGRRQFLEKWGISQSVFYTYYLKMGADYQGSLSKPAFTLGYAWGMLRSKVKLRFAFLRKG